MLKGSLVALVTPFDASDRVDDAALSRLIDFHVEAGSDGLVIAGTTGESPTLDSQEHADLIFRAAELAAGRIPVIAGTGSNSTRQTMALSQQVQGAAIDAFLLVVPYYNKPTQQGLIEHFVAIADSVEKPVILYNVPGRTVADLQPATVAALAAHPNILGIKEATGDLQRLAQIRELVGDDFLLFSGDDFTVLEFLRQGGHGVITVSGNVVPAATAELCRLVASGQIEAAEALDARLQPLNEALFVESNPIPVKWAVAEMGLMEHGIRLPLTGYSDIHHEQMRAAMTGAGVDFGDQS